MMTRSKRLAVILVVLTVLVTLIDALLFGFGHAQAQTTRKPQFPKESMMDKIQNRGKLITGVRYDVPEMGYLNPATGKLEGVDVDLMRELAKAIFGDSTKVEFKQATAKTRIPMLEQGDVDATAANFTITEERKQVVDFSKPYVTQRYKLAVLANSGIREWKDLPGKTVVIVKGADYCVPAYEKHGCKILRLESVADMLTALKTRRADALFNSEWPIDSMVAANPDVKLASFFQPLDAMEPNALGVAFAKGHPEFVEFFNELLVKLCKSGRILEIVRQAVPAADAGSVCRF